MKGAQEWWRFNGVGCVAHHDGFSTTRLEGGNRQGRLRTYTAHGTTTRQCTDEAHRQAQSFWLSQGRDLYACDPTTGRKNRHEWPDENDAKNADKPSAGLVVASQGRQLVTSPYTAERITDASPRMMKKKSAKVTT